MRAELQKRLSLSLFSLSVCLSVSLSLSLSLSLSVCLCVCVCVCVCLRPILHLLTLVMYHVPCARIRCGSMTPVLRLCCKYLALPSLVNPAPIASCPLPNALCAVYFIRCVLCQGDEQGLASWSKHASVQPNTRKQQKPKKGQANKQAQRCTVVGLEVRAADSAF